MFGAIYLPAFEAVAALDHLSALRGLPCAVLAEHGETEKAKAKALILAVNPPAAAWGIIPGWTVARARARCAELRTFPRNPDREKQLTARLLELADSLTPDFEQTQADTLLLDLHGNPQAQLHPPPRHLPGLRFRRAATPEIALLAAFDDSASSDRFIQKEDLHSLPFDLIRCASFPGAEDLLGVLQTWGIRTFGEFLRLPATDLAERLGPQARHLHRVLNGRSERLLRLHRPNPTFAGSVSFEQEATSWEPLLFEAKRLLDTLCARLQASHRAAKEVVIQLLFEAHDPFVRRLSLPEPEVLPSRLLPPLQAILEPLRMPAPVVGLALELLPVKPQGAQRAWFGPQLRQPHRCPETLLRLETLLVEENIGIPVPEDSHRPDAFRLQPPDALPSKPAPSATSPPPLPVSPIPLRRFRPPPRIRVATDPAGSPPRPLALLGGPHAGTVVASRGPFPVSGNWWSERPWQQLEWDVQLDTGRLLRLAHHPPDDWRIEGLYD